MQYIFKLFKLSICSDDNTVNWSTSTIQVKLHVSLLYCILTFYSDVHLELTNSGKKLNFKSINSIWEKIKPKYLDNINYVLAPIYRLDETFIIGVIILSHTFDKTSINTKAITSTTSTTPTTGTTGITPTTGTTGTILPCTNSHNSKNIIQYSYICNIKNGTINHISGSSYLNIFKGIVNNKCNDTTHGRRTFLLLLACQS